MPDEDPKDLIKLADPVEAAKYKMTGLKEWIAREWPKPLDRHLGSLPMEVKAVLDALKDVTDHEDPVFDADVLDGRYLVLKIVFYENDGGDDGPEMDHNEYALAQTLEAAQAEVEDHVFAAVRSGYSHVCRVFDTHLKKELLFEEVHKIEWKLDEKPEPPAAVEPEPPKPVTYRWCRSHGMKMWHVVSDDDTLVRQHPEAKEGVEKNLYRCETACKREEIVWSKGALFEGTERPAFSPGVSSVCHDCVRWVDEKVKEATSK